MQLETYSFIKRPASYYYEFYSDGPNGKVKKVVEFFRLQDYKEGVYNLAFGDWDDNKQCINDLAITNNSDRDKVLATVAATVLEFMKDHPQAIVLAAKLVTGKGVKDYTNDPYFVTKRETAKAFLKKAGLPIVRF